jgi:hypothetical protein
MTQFIVDIVIDVVSKVIKKWCMSLRWLPSDMSFMTKMFSSLDDMDDKW